MGWQRLAPFLFILAFTLLWFGVNSPFKDKEVIIFGVPIIGGAWLVFIIGTIVHYRKLKKQGYIK